MVVVTNISDRVYKYFLIVPSLDYAEHDTCRKEYLMIHFSLYKLVFLAPDIEVLHEQTIKNKQFGILTINYFNII